MIVLVRLLVPIGVLFGSFGRKIDGFRSLVYLVVSSSIPGPSISLKRTPMLVRLLGCRPRRLCPGPWSIENWLA